MLLPPTNPALDWQADALDGYRRHVFELGRDPDGEGEIAAVLVRREPREGESVHGTVLYVHGFSDYFFQTELADFFAARGVAFYALDLRKCGRGLRPGQSGHYVSKLAYYDEELELALAAIAAEHPGLPVLLAAHSTGGLILPLWVDRRRAESRDEGGELRQGAGPGPVSGLVLNSPWLDLQVYPASRRAAMTQMLRLAAKLAPKRAVKLSPTSVYGDTLHVSGTGEWEYDLALKPSNGFPVKFGWLNAVRRGHARLHRGLDLGVPALVLRSDRTHFSRRKTELSDRADLVLDVQQIARRAGCLGAEATVSTIAGARHDVFLSLPEVRGRAYAALGAWLDQHPEATGADRGVEVAAVVEAVDVAAVVEAAQEGETVDAAQVLETVDTAQEAETVVAAPAVEMVETAQETGTVGVAPAAEPGAAEPLEAAEAAEPAESA